MQLIKRYWIQLLGGAIGALGGYLYWHFVGCSSGTCPITSSPTWSIIFGTLIGISLSGMFTKKESNNKKNEE